VFHRIMVDEDSFRSFHLKNDSIQARIGVVLLIAPLALFSFKDYDFFRLSLEFYGLAALRLCVISLCLWLIYKLGRIRDYREYDRCLFFVGLAITAAVSLINLSRPRGITCS